MINLLYSVLVPLAFISCGGGSGDEPDTPQPVMNITLSQQSIREGAEVDAESTTILTLTYSHTVKPSGSGVTLNGSTLTAKNNVIDTKAIDIPLQLEEGVAYELKVAAGAIVSATNAKVSAPELTLHFTTQPKVEPTNPNIAQEGVSATTTEAKKLYRYMRNLYGRKTLSSVMADVNWNNRCAEKVHSLTGKYPAMNCYDFIHIFVPYQGSNGWIDYNNITPVREWTDAGGLVQLMWHFNVPLSEKTEVKTDGSGVTCSPGETTFRALNALVSGTWENKWFYGQMDLVINVLLKLQEAGIAATWRPFHEAAGNACAKQQAGWTTSWFWWGADGAETYKRLWVAMFDYFRQKGVGNLLWVWTTQNCNGNSAQFNQDTDWYPGDNYVDMVARDLYGFDANRNGQEFTEIQAAYPNKMVVLGECGRSGSVEQGLMGECWSAGAQWGQFMVWYQGGQGSTDTMCSDAWWKNAMADPNVITRDQVKY